MARKYDRQDPADHVPLVRQEPQYPSYDRGGYGEYGNRTRRERDCDDLDRRHGDGYSSIL